MVGVAWLFKLLIESPYKSFSSWAAVVSLSTDWGATVKGFSAYECVKYNNTSTTSVLFL
jgi:hypothetical protein